MNRNDLFMRFIVIVGIVLGLFGAGMIVVSIWGDRTLALRMINVFAGAFGTFVGFGSGFLIGRRNGDVNGE